MRAVARRRGDPGGAERLRPCRRPTTTRSRLAHEPGGQRTSGGWMLTIETATRPAPSGTPHRNASAQPLRPLPRSPGRCAKALTIARGEEQEADAEHGREPGHEQAGDERDHDRAAGPRHEHEPDRRDRGDHAGRDDRDHGGAGAAGRRRGASGRSSRATRSSIRVIRAAASTITGSRRRQLQPTMPVALAPSRPKLTAGPRRAGRGRRSLLVHAERADRRDGGTVSRRADIDGVPLELARDQVGGW